ncbi:BlaI/MecI/CopY family transcriptional regulator [Lutispora sp.]|uniref:BlaI/MecI/CopY family transcriptional regulator n=1 Tax=Lutispora sp. TaxID=2828727 RepID=UPI000EDBE46A|nr:BlaI/MecI/CopY family transcriptional regulator [Lutispora sp.]MEA4963416.1 BlaI/MecI/CopY family transcriptional regulator [Lutispora sp.]HCJ56240.1 penicillinase repressor [Clostridiaceae bacterium]
MKRLPDSELELMLIIWDADEAVSRTYIQERLEKSKGLAATTILSFLSRLESKGFVKVEKRGKNNYYYPLVRQEDYIKNESKTMLERFFGNSLKNFVVQLNDANAVDERQIQELKEFLDDLSLEESKK